MLENNGIGERIKAKREENKWSQEELAKRMGYSTKSTITKIETGINDVSSSTIFKFANVLGTTVEYLMGINTKQNVSISTKEICTIELTGDDLQDIINFINYLKSRRE